MNVFHSFVCIATAFAEAGPGLLPDNVVEAIEKLYLQYRDDYNSNLANHSHFVFVSFS